MRHRDPSAGIEVALPWLFALGAAATFGAARTAGGRTGELGDLLVHAAFVGLVAWGWGRRMGPCLWERLAEAERLGLSFERGDWGSGRTIAVVLACGLSWFAFEVAAPGALGRYVGPQKHGRVLELGLVLFGPAATAHTLAAVLFVLRRRRS